MREAWARAQKSAFALPASETIVKQVTPGLQQRHFWGISVAEEVLPAKAHGD